MKTGRGRVWLVGAGCGGPELLTLRGRALLEQCETVVFDDLIDSEILAFVPETAERVYMGKRSGAHSASQEEICAMLIRLAKAGRRVVRLKGGDPFVFGRGAEELQALQAEGIPCEAVPGVSSAIAIPELAGIPVTCRGLSQSVHIVTAHTAGTADGLPGDFDALAALEGTLVFLMGLRQLPNIVRRLIAAGKDPETPAAVLSGGNSPHPAAVRGPLCQLPELARAVRPPAVIVVGRTAGLELASAIPDRRPLSGLRVGLVGTPAIQGKLALPLASLGADVLRPLTLEVRPLPFDLRAALEGCPWLVFTSGNGVRRFFAALREAEVDLRELAAKDCRLAVIGQATAAALWEYNIHPDLMPDTATTAALAECLRRRVPAQHRTRIVLLRSAQASGELAEALRGFQVEDLRIYDACPRKGAAENPDYLIFASAGGVRAYCEAFGLPAPPVRCVCIGPVTAAALRERTDAPFLMAPDISAAGLLQTILDSAAGTPPA